MKKIRILCECALLLALGIVLSCIELYKMPMGGGITVVSMLPVLLAGTRHGPRWGLCVSVLAAAFQLIQALVQGNVFPYVQSGFAIIACVLFDYVVPFGALGLSGLTSSARKNRKWVILGTYAVLIFVRFVCHFITGVVIWGQWAPEGMGKYLYSLLYNGGYMLGEFILTLAVTALLLSIPASYRLFRRDPASC